MAEINNNTELKYIDDSSDETLLKDLCKKVDSWYSYFNEHIERARNFISFLYVDQWDITIRQDRERLGKPTLQFNKLVPIIRGILGDQRDDSPQLAVQGVGDNIDQAAVDLRSDLVRQIAYESDSDMVYQVAFKYMMECGYGAARVITKYEGPDTFNQCIKILPILDYQSAFWDPAAQLSDKSDGDFCGTYTIISKDHFNRLHPGIPNPESSMNMYYFAWTTRETVTLCEIYYKEYYKKVLVQLSDGQLLDEKEAKDLIKTQTELFEANPDDFELMGINPLTIINEREVNDYKICHVKFVQNAILEKTDWPGKILPIVYFDGDSTMLDGERLPLPFVQDAIDTQKYINYVGSEIAYQVLTSHAEKVMGTDSNFEGHEEQWRNPQRVQGALIANPDEETRAMPIFIDPPAFNKDLLATYQNSANDLQQTLGRYEEARGQQSNAMSGVAIAERKESSNAPVNVYEDNLSRGIKQIGKIVLELIPKIYDNQRTVITRNVEGKVKPVNVNQKAGFEYGKDGQLQDVIKNDMTTGEYDIEVRVDGSFTAQKAKAFDTFARLIAVNPQVAALVMDKMAEVSGLENASQIQKRLETLVPPNILATEKGLPPPAPPPPPPPDPMVEIAAKDVEIKDKKVDLDAINKAKELDIKAQQAGVNNNAAFIKSMAEIIKSRNGLAASTFSDMASMATAKGQQKSDETIAQAEMRRDTLDMQAQTLKEMGI